MPFDNLPEKVEAFPEFQILIEARNLLLAEGWIQRDVRSRKGRCISGAIMDAGVHMTPLQRQEAQTKARDVLRSLVSVKQHWFVRLFGGKRVWLSTWNDAPGRTKDEAIALFDRAIDVKTTRRGGDR
jgi:hypothetical protein